MEENRKKSKALIITIIAVIILLIIAYLLFFRNNGNYGIQSSSTTTSGSAASTIKDFFAQIFNPKAKQTNVTTVTTTTKTPGQNTSSTTGTTGTNAGVGTGTPGTGGALGTTGGLGNGTGLAAGTGANNGTGLGTGTGIDSGTGLTSNTGSGANAGYTATLQPLPTPTDTNNGGPAGTTTQSSQGINPFPQCSDGIDNNGNGLIDIQEPGCHTDFNPSNTTSYDPSLNDESRTNPNIAASNPNQCPSDDPLVFTATEQAQLADLLTQYYAIAPNLKTSDDLALLQSNIATDQSLIDQANSLTSQCNAEKADPAYTGPQAIEDNPYYQNSSGSAASYLPGVTSTWISANNAPTNVTDALQNYSDFEKKFSIW